MACYFFSHTFSRSGLRLLSTLRIYVFRAGKPSQEMREFIMHAEVGDDVFSEDPTINALQARVMELTGKEAALFVPTATMSNQIAARTHLTQGPYSVICDHRAHVHNYESGGISFFTGATLIAVPPNEGEAHLTADAVEKYLVLDDDVHHSPTKLVCMENTLNGEVVPLKNIEEVTALARKHDLRTHLDGARLWNASAATGISLKEYASHFDSVTLCLSKGLGAPVGSILVGSKPFIKKATHYRKMFGGGMRQAGLLAAACMYALDHNLPNLPRDHANAQHLAQGIMGLNAGFKLVKSVDSNMVWVDSPVSADVLCAELAKHDIRIFAGATHQIRFVLHLQTRKEDCDKLLQVLGSLEVLKKNA
ncbi:pyridoxal phosphate-dependent transferase [Powellomyces hirtus]|nr:pyridoxal phosphate-dependent transferase [Powellomyces hirtus]